MVSWPRIRLLCLPLPWMHFRTQRFKINLSPSSPQERIISVIYQKVKTVGERAKKSVRRVRWCSIGISEWDNVKLNWIHARS